MEIEQLELDLWQSLEIATKFPQVAEFCHLCTALELELAERPVLEQLQVASNVIVQLSQIYAARVEILLSEWERRYNPTEPIVDIDRCIELFVQSQHLDVAELFEPPDTVNYPQQRQIPNPEKNSSVVGQVDKSILLQHLDDLVGEAPIQSQEQQMQQIRELAHDEDVSAWTSAIAQFLSSRQVQSVRLLELVEGVQYPTVEPGEQQRLGIRDREPQALAHALATPLVQTWLALLLGGFELKQSTDDFYYLEGIWVQNPE